MKSGGELKEESLNKFRKRGKGAISGLENRERKSEPGMRSRKQKSPTLTLFDQQVSVPWRNKMKHAAHKPEEGLCRKWKWGTALWTPGQDEASPCEVQGNRGGQYKHLNVSWVTHSGAHPDFMHLGTRHHGWKKLCKTGTIFRNLSLLFARQRWSETSPSISRHTLSPAEEGDHGQRSISQQN